MVASGSTDAKLPPSPRFLRSSQLLTRSQIPNSTHISAPHRKEFLVKTYESANLRNVAVVGHSHSGKTSLISALLYTGGATPRLRRVDDGSAATAWDDEEIARQMSITSTPAFVEWDKCKINLIDTPG